MNQKTVMETLSSEFAGLMEKASPSIVLVPGRRSSASGIVWRKNLVITADHLLGRAGNQEVMTSSGESIGATVAGRDPSTDIAILKTKSELQAVEAATEAPIKAGQLAISLGRAAGGRLLGALTMISGADEAYRNWRGGTFDHFIRLDLAPFPGFSGSALLMPDGRIAGMNTSAFSRHLGMTVPASNIERLVQRLSIQGYVGKPYLGLMMQPVRLPEKLRQSGSDIGLLVMGTEDASPAERAGVLLGDVVVRWDDKTIHSMDTIHDLLTEFSIGKGVKIGILRGGQALDLNVKIGERPLQQNP